MKSIAHYKHDCMFEHSECMYIVYELDSKKVLTLHSKKVDKKMIPLILIAESHYAASL